MHRLVCIKSFFTEILRNKQGRTVYDIKTMQTKNDVNKKMRIKRQMDLLLKNIRRKMRDMPTTVQKRNSQKNSCENPYRVKNFVCQMLFVNIFKYHLYRFLLCGLMNLTNFSKSKSISNIICHMFHECNCKTAICLFDSFVANLKFDLM